MCSTVQRQKRREDTETQVRMGLADQEHLCACLFQRSDEGDGVRQSAQPAWMQSGTFQIVQSINDDIWRNIQRRPFAILLASLLQKWRRRPISEKRQRSTLVRTRTDFGLSVGERVRVARRA